MARHRPLISALLGLLLLVQGFAVAAADYSFSRQEAATEQGIPCHEPAADDLSCCDAECPDMTRCLLGQLAPAANGLVLDPVAPDLLLRTEPLASAPASSPQTLLRPPIVCHA